MWNWAMVGQQLVVNLVCLVLIALVVFTFGLWLNHQRDGEEKKVNDVLPQLKGLGSELCPDCLGSGLVGAFPGFMGQHCPRCDGEGRLPL